LEISKSALAKQLSLWNTHVPWIRPFYAVKCNNDPTLMRWMNELHPNMGFDCASLREIEEVQTALNHRSNSQTIIYAQPCKKRQDIAAATALGVSRTVVDSQEEVEKLAACGWKGDILVRLLVEDRASKQPFGKKFGAPLEWLDGIYRLAAREQLSMTGFSFHVGSECQAPEQYAAAIQRCWRGAEIADDHGFATHTIDIGGGFLPDEISFCETAEALAVAREKAPLYVEWIAEPGRFLAAPTHTLWTPVIGRKRVWPPPLTDRDPEWRITVDESVYGVFSNIPFDGQRPVFEVPSRRGEWLRPFVVFGRTCDSGDCIGDRIMMPKGVDEGDVLRVPNMGAYTTVTASEFNGFPKAERRYIP